MHFLHLLYASLAAFMLEVRASNCSPFPSSVVEFSSGFEQPEPPSIKAEYGTNFIQHKWNQNLSHITTGYIRNSPSQLLVRADEAYDGTLASSVFNYANSTKEGLVDNTLTSYDESGKPTVWRGWNIMYQGAIPVTVYVNSCNIMVGYDYFSPGLRTRVITEYFNIQA
ncbi:hypothetical protein N7509_007961 [Penicillium cosmopolitanum]|uniref:Uncharacterized protein n=1 Tax=Penicillium cosmopolitanum TaxID=1131564 RepID=A0A9W9W057_9EURO|nr:uncharacterized protein N7509_007961 [Penicillium cosmopolitanum]KAJ5392471.1 hypothetical protein N7509_007961 [Penicillium cosmopolitanum]